MSNHGDSNSGSPALVNNRTMDIVVALLIIAMASVFLFDSWKTGFGWIEGQGPAPGFFPFYVSLVMGIASAFNLVRAMTGAEADGRETFVTRGAFFSVLLVLIPTALYVALIQFLGIYVASAIFICGFMLASKEHPLKAVGIGLAVPLALFFMFEKWFLVPLPKGPLEAILGL